VENHGIRPHWVVGHSSGEIAAAYVAGLLTLDDAIKIAYFRGQAAQGACDTVKERMGMMAAELDPQIISKYFIGLEDKVHIACHNSPSNVTLAGVLSALEKVQARLRQDKHACRMLQIDIPYHSKFVAATAEAFEQFTLQERPLVQDLGCSGDVTMLSTVTGSRLEGRTCNSSYWRANLESPVLFRHAMEDILRHDQHPDILIEIGPSDTLRGPVMKLKHSLGQGDGPLKDTDIQYLSALHRGDMSAHNMLHLLGSLYLSGYPVQMQGAYPLLSDEAHSVIVDLPNYRWNHTAKYWYKCEVSKDGRVRKVPHRDLGSEPSLGASMDKHNGVIARNTEELNQSMQKTPETTVSPGECGDLLSKKLSNMLRLTGPIDPEKLLSSYGLDSLSRIQLRLWLNTQLSVDVSTFDIINTLTLASLRDMVAGKLRVV
jgi:acyl transferase domain-containing protein